MLIIVVIVVRNRSNRLLIGITDESIVGESIIGDILISSILNRFVTVVEVVGRGYIL